MESDVLSAVEVLEEAVQILDADVVDPGYARRLLALFARGERACAGAGAVLARRVRDPKMLARQSGTSVGKARAVVALSDRIEDTPVLAAAVRGGQLSLDQATEIAGAETAAPGSADTLVEVAKTEPFHVLRAKSRNVVLESTRESLRERQHKARRAGHHITPLGMVHVEADLEPQVGAPIVERLETEAKRLAAKDTSDTSIQAHLADAFASCFTQPGTGRSPKPEVVVVVSHEVTQRGWSTVEPGEVCHIPGVGPIDPQVARDLAQDAFINGVICDGNDLRQMRRWTRHIPVEIKLALKLGPPPDFDGPRCIDCGNWYRLEHDHQQPYAEHGPTSLDNLPNRCHPCHTAKTRRDARRRRGNADSRIAAHDRGPP